MTREPVGDGRQTGQGPARQCLPPPNKTQNAAPRVLCVERLSLLVPRVLCSILDHDRMWAGPTHGSPPRSGEPAGWAAAAETLPRPAPPALCIERQSRTWRGRLSAGDSARRACVQPERQRTLGAMLPHAHRCRAMCCPAGRRRLPRAGLVATPPRGCGRRASHPQRFFLSFSAAPLLSPSAAHIVAADAGVWNLASRHPRTAVTRKAR